MDRDGEAVGETLELRGNEGVIIGRRAIEQGGRRSILRTGYGSDDRRLLPRAREYPSPEAFAASGFDLSKGRGE